MYSMKHTTKLFKQKRDASCKLNQAIDWLNVFGIAIELDHINNCIFLYTDDHRFMKCDHIAESVKDLRDDYFGKTKAPFKWNKESELALALAETQEGRNDHVLDSEIEDINEFFSVNIDRKLIRTVGGYFI